MAVNRVEFGGEVLIDISDSTVNTNSLLNGTVAYAANGTKITGNVVIQRYYTGSEDPSSSLGNNGDLYLKV